MAHLAANSSQIQVSETQFLLLFVRSAPEDMPEL